MLADIPDATLSYQPNRVGVAISWQMDCGSWAAIAKTACTGDRRQPKQAIDSDASGLADCCRTPISSVLYFL